MILADALHPADLPQERLRLLLDCLILLLWQPR